LVKIVDVLSTIKTLLDSDWLKANSDSLTPTVRVISEKKQIMMSDGDHILLYEINENIDSFGLGATDWAHDRVASIDIRTTYKRAEISDIRAHLIKIKDEVFRIIKANVANPDTDHQLLVPLRRRDLSDKHTGVGRMVIDVSLKYWGN